MLVLGLTGPSGSGKGAVGCFFAETGIPVLDTDTVYHALIDHPTSCTEELKNAFGDTILTKEGGIDRKRLASLVFDPTDEKKEKLLLLNKITHRYVLDTCRLWLKEQEKKGRRASVIDAPLLYESGFDKECDKVIAVLAPRETRLARIMLRDALTAVAAEARLSSQASDAFYKEKADFLIQNDGSLAHLKEKVFEIVEGLDLR